MKWLFVLIFLILPTPSDAQALSCSYLFTNDSSETAISNSFPATTLRDLTQEGADFNESVSHGMKIQGHRESLTEEQFYKMDDAFRIFYTEILDWKDRSVDLELKVINESATQKDLIELRNIQNNYVLGSAGVTARMSAYLKTLGINHEMLLRNNTEIKEPTYSIVISKNGDHLVNQLASRLDKKYFLDLILDPISLVESGFSGIFDALSNKKPRIILDPTIIMDESVLQNGTALHEHRHNMNFWQKVTLDKKPYHARIKIENTTKSIRERLGAYHNYFSVDEISAHRTSIRVGIHKALTHPKEHLETYFEEIQRDVEKEIIFSEVTEKAFRAHKENTARIQEKLSWFNKIKQKLKKDIKPKTSEIMLSKHEHYQILANESMTTKTLEMAEFTYTTYTLIALKLHEVEKKNSQEKLRALKQILKVINLPSVKKLDGNYPPVNQVSKLLNEK